MKNFNFWFATFILSYLQATFIAFPISLPFIVAYAATNKKISSLFLAFFAGIINDVFSMDAIGKTSFYYITCVFLILLYGDKFETGTPRFVLIFNFIFSFVFMIVFYRENIFLGALLSTFISFIAFLFADINIRKVKFSL